MCGARAAFGVPRFSPRFPALALLPSLIPPALGLSVLLSGSGECPGAEGNFEIPFLLQLGLYIFATVSVSTSVCFIALDTLDINSAQLFFPRFWVHEQFREAGSREFHRLLCGKTTSFGLFFVTDTGMDLIKRVMLGFCSLSLLFQSCVLSLSVYPAILYFRLKNS